MAEKIKVLETDIQRADDVFYFVKANEQGLLEIWATLRKQGGTKNAKWKKARIIIKKVPRKKYTRTKSRKNIIEPKPDILLQ
jgi:hypothetical protein